jgi:hypothetical protein
MIFNFYSRGINTSKRPSCPKCKKKELKRMISNFSTISGMKEDTEGGMPDIDESKLERAIGALASEAEKINEDDPKQAARLMRKFTEMTGINLGSKMDEAISRLEAGEDPDEIEAEMGDMLDDEEPFVFEKKKGRTSKIKAPKRDETLYEL